MLLGVSMALVSAVPAQANLVGYWTFNNPSPLDDSSGNGFTLSNSGAVTGGAGRAGEGLQFDNTTDRATASDAPVLHAPAFSISTWVNPASLDTKVTLIDKEHASATRVSWGMEMLADNKFNFFLFNTSGTPDGLQSTTVAALNNWYHVVGTYDGTSTFNLYINGLLESTKVSPGLGGPDYDTSVLSMGRRVSAFPNDTFLGRLDEVQLYDQVLTASEVSSLFNNPEVNIFNVPEPTTMTLIALGGLSIVRWRGRRER